MDRHYTFKIQIKMKTSVFLILFVIGHSESSCPKTNEECSCSKMIDGDSSGWVISCNASDTVQYKITYKMNTVIDLNCAGSGAPYRIAMYQNYTLQYIKAFSFTNCPLPNIPLSDILRGNKQIVDMAFSCDNCIQDVPLNNSIFNGLKDLQSLKIQDYNFSTIPEKLFESLTGLIDLNLEYNNFEYLKPNTFRNLTKLKSLILNQNSLTELPESLFEDLVSLETLILSYNKLVSLPDLIFANQTRLEFLNLDFNVLHSLQKSLFTNTFNLTTLNIDQTQIMEFESGIFHKNLTKLNTINVGNNNNLTNVPEKLLAGLPNITMVDFSMSNIHNWSDKFFSYTPKLKTINIAANDIEVLPANIFQYNEQLTILNLAFNKLETLPDGIFDRIFYLRELYLNNNRFLSFSDKIFENLKSLKILDIHKNFLVSFKSSILNFSSNLEELRVQENNISLLEGMRPFGLGDSLKSVNFSKNKIINLPSINWPAYIVLKTVDLSFNHIEFVNLPRTNGDNTQLYLNNNNIQSISVEDLIQNDKNLQAAGYSNSGTHFYLANNPFNCNCSLFEFKKYVQNALANKAKMPGFPDANKLTCATPNENDFLKLQDKQFICQLSNQCPENCNCFRQALGNVTVLDCEKKGLKTLPLDIPENTSVALLQGNELTELKGLDGSVWNKLIKLYADNNQIVADNWILPRSLKEITLSGNKLKWLPNQIYQFVDSYDLINLSGNPWSCNCSNINFKNMLLTKSFKVKDESEIKCANPDNLLDRNVDSLKDYEMCPIEANGTHNVNIIVSITFCMILALLGFVICVIYYRNKKTIQAYIYVHYHKLFSLLFNADMDEDRPYHAFVSYSNEDRAIVMTLMEELEEKVPSFKLCIHERDWAPGNLIIYNIVHSVQNSKRTILILSKDFLKSIWFQLEFHIAYYQMLEDKIDRLILIVVGELPDKNTLDADLQFLLKAKTYLVWGEQWFWEKLKYALPHKMKIPEQPSPEKPPNQALIQKIEDTIMLYTANTVRQYDSFDLNTQCSSSLEGFPMLNLEVPVDMREENKTELTSEV